ncbi:hypothetical protein [Acrocarpospora macrocephala]|uniref:hypothetical protein n=1 Tax=Acrocarpospora macrocephala TaxID=150177 RepID=UPI0012D2EB8A|nr:hypothetical protein [Acrocarpospora macrocephala]
MNLLKWVRLEVENGNGQTPLLNTELDDVWNAANIALSVVQEGEIGYRRINELVDHIGPGHGRREAITFETIARYAGPILAILNAKLNNWPSGRAYEQPRQNSVTLPTNPRQRRRRDGRASPGRDLEPG